MSAETNSLGSPVTAADLVAVLTILDPCQLRVVAKERSDNDRAQLYAMAFLSARKAATSVACLVDQDRPAE